jgi:hypothetical protein
MFAVGFPVAPFFVQLNNLIERKTDALKTVKMRRPRYRGGSGIGSWQAVLEFLTVFSVITNMLILFFASSVIRDTIGRQLAPVDVLMVIVVVEHLLLAIKFGISIAVPDTPRWVARAKERALLRKNLQKVGETAESAAGRTRGKHAPSRAACAPLPRRLPFDQRLFATALTALRPPCPLPRSLPPRALRRSQEAGRSHGSRQRRRRWRQASRVGGISLPSMWWASRSSRAARRARDLPIGLLLLLKLWASRSSRAARRARDLPIGLLLLLKLFS